MILETQDPTTPTNKTIGGLVHEAFPRNSYVWVLGHALNQDYAAMTVVHTRDGIKNAGPNIARSATWRGLFIECPGVQMMEESLRSKLLVQYTTVCGMLDAMLSLIPPMEGKTNFWSVDKQLTHVDHWKIRLVLNTLVGQCVFYTAAEDPVIPLLRLWHVIMHPAVKQAGLYYVSAEDFSFDFAARDDSEAIEPWWQGEAHGPAKSG